MPIITYVVFRGTGKREHHGLRKLGHLGLQFPESRRYYGWHPAPAEETPDLERILKTHERPVQGQVYDDTAVFYDAAAQARRGERTTVYAWNCVCDEDTLHTALTRFEQQLEHPNPPWYELPPRDPSQVMPPHLNNCVTWPRTLGLPVLDERGSIVHAIENLQARLGWYSLDLS